MSEPFDVIPYADISGEWKQLGAGSFGNVYKGTYLGIDVAIKEVLPSNEYDVAKYFEREWRLMKECRHPNICLFIGLSRAPEPDGRIFIISEFIDNGNVRLFIHDKTKPFPWRLRLSFAIDVARALAYLHARKCIHRDLKGENLLVTSNGRIKVTDFGFARIAARNEEESKRLTFCGTDSYMSPEILLGDEFDLPTDVFSLGIIFCEIAARKLADNSHFKRHPPDFGIDPDEVRELASPGCPPEFINLCLECLDTDPAKRPMTRSILERLTQIEAELLLRPEEGEDVHVGSIKFMTGGGGKRPANAPRIPSFGMGVGKSIRGNGDSNTNTSDESDDELIEAVMGLSQVGLKSDWSELSSGSTPLLDAGNNPQANSQYSTTVVRSHSNQHHTPPPALSSILTIRPSPDPSSTPAPVLPATPPSHSPSPSNSGPLGMNEASTFSIATMDSYHTAPGSTISSTKATEGGSTIRALDENGIAVPLVHRFTLIKPGVKPRKISPNHNALGIPTNDGRGEHVVIGSGSGGAVWNPLDLFFSSGLLVAKCDVCFKRLGWKPVLECDDCGLKAHIKCGEVAPKDCGMRPRKLGVHHQSSVPPLQAISPLSRVKRDMAQASEVVSKAKGKSQGVGKR